MMPLILLAIIAGVPLLVALVFRVSAVFLFLSLAVGDFLVKYLSDDVSFAISAFVKGPKAPMVTQLCLLLLPVVLTLLFLRKTISTSKFLLHILPLASTSLSIAVLTIPLLASGTQSQIFSTPIGNTLRQAQDLIISVTAVMVLLLTWFSYRHRADKHGKHHR